MDGWLGSNHHGTCWLSWKFNGSSNSLVEKVEQVILQSFSTVFRSLEKSKRVSQSIFKPKTLLCNNLNISNKEEQSGGTPD